MRDGLLYAGEPGVQLTWMDAKVDDWVVTPRIGKPVEINALWIHALRLMAKFAQQVGHAEDASAYLATCRSKRRRVSGSATGMREGGYLYDVIDGPSGNDSSLRPNQLLALSLEPDLLDARSGPIGDRCVRAAVADFVRDAFARADPRGLSGHLHGRSVCARRRVSSRHGVELADRPVCRSALQRLSRSRRRR